MSVSRDAARGGGACKKYFESATTTAKLQNVVTYLQKNHGGDVENESLTPSSIASLLASMVQFQEDHFGKDGDHRDVLVRWPAKLFRDFKKGGAVCVLLGAFFKYKKEHSLRKIDFSSDSRVKKYCTIFTALDTALKEAEKIAMPRVFMHPSLDDSVKKQLQEIAERMHCTIVAKKANASIALLAPVALSTEEEWMRPVAKDDELSAVHWWYLPDSYDTWVSTDKVHDALQKPKTEACFEVNANWLVDSARFNEFMNPEDYEREDGDVEMDPKEFLASINPPSETPDVTEDAPSTSDGATHAATNGSDAADLHKKRRRPSEPQGDHKEGGGRGKRARAVAKAADPLLNVPAPTTPNVVVHMDESTIEGHGRQPPRNTKVMDVPSAAEEAFTAADAEKDPSHVVEEQKLSVIVPSSAAWFDYNALDEIEVKALPEFFNGSSKAKAPEIYMAYRNFMIDTYRLNPREYLTATACRRSLTGDVGCILRVHAFLEQWGLINYQVEYDSRPTPMAPPSASHFMVLADTPNGLVPYFSEAEREMAKMPAVDRVVTLQPVSKPKKAPGFGLHPDVYLGAEQHSVMDDREWTDRETLYLLEGIDQFKDDWMKVAEHVNKEYHNGESVRTHDECIAAFVRMPIEDPYLDPDNIVGQSRADDVPFSGLKNPLFATLSFLMKHVGEGIAAAGAQGALKAIETLRPAASSATAPSSAPGPASTPAPPPTAQQAAGTVADAGAGTAAGASSNAMDVDPTPDATATGSAVGSGDQMDESPDGTSGVETGENSAAPSNSAATSAPEVSAADAAAQDAKFVRQELSKDKIEQVCKRVLGSAAEKAALLAKAEERRLKGLVALLVETQLEKLEIKLRQFNELEELLESERRKFEQERLELVNDRIKFEEQKRKFEEEEAKFAAELKQAGVGTAAAAAATTTQSTA
eukprot:m.1481305 g.1481305  ORF g.1481305 m.1481305 type:complete len:928 (+) comp25175_c0_seq2:188-2971(+)